MACLRYLLFCFVRILYPKTQLPVNPEIHVGRGRAAHGPGPHEFPGKSSKRAPDLAGFCISLIFLPYSTLATKSETLGVELMTTAPAPEAITFRAEIRQLLNILVHSLYTDRE